MSDPHPSTLPFDGAISRFLAHDAPAEIREAITEAKPRDILRASYPYERWMKKSDYEDEMKLAQVELVKFQSWVQKSRQRVVVLFEGRDTAGKSSAIKVISENLNPRVARIHALPSPTEREAAQWFFQRYAAVLPPAGEIALFDRSWYNRGVIDEVFDFATHEQRERFFSQLPDFEHMLVEDGIALIKIWFDVGRAEQLRRMLDRERHVLKQWKLSKIDVEGLSRWDAYTDAIGETFARSNFSYAPWTVILGDDKYRARLAAIRSLLSRFDYTGKDEEALGAIDPKITGTTALWSAT